MTEQQYQKKLIDEYESNGWYVIKLIKTNKNGIPDLICLREDKKPLFIEVKAKNGKVSKLQWFRLDELLKAGFNAKVMRAE